MEGRNWLGFGARSRTPQVIHAPVPALKTTQSDLGASPASVTEERNLQRSSTQIQTQQPPQKTARLSRISSYIGLGGVAKAHATTATSTPYPEQIMQRSESLSSRATSYQDVPHDPSAGIWHTRPNTNGGFVYKQSDQTWHNPNLMQMMDTVSSTIMSNGVSEPIPRHLNSFVVGMVEEFRIRLGKQSALEVRFEDLLTTRKKEIQEFAAMADEWKYRETTFKAEVKRLEQIIAANDGMHSVVAARAGSMYNRSDSKAFQAKLNRLSKNEDENLGLDKVQQIVMEDEIRNFAVLHNIKDSDREIVLDHNSDAFISEHFRPGAGPANKRNTSPDPLGERMAAAQRFMDDNGRPRLPSNSCSKVTSPRKSHSTVSSSGVPSSASSSLITQGILAARAAQDHVTPHTTPPRPEPVKPSTVPNAVQAKTGASALQTIQELTQMNGGLPEDAIDDESSYGPSFVPPHHSRTRSFDHGHDKAPAPVHDKAPAPVHDKASAAVHDANMAAVELKVDHNGQQRPPQLALRRTAPTQVDGFDSDVPRDVGREFLKKTYSSSSSGSSQSSCRSATLMAMAHNCIDHIGQSGGPDCPRNSPMKKAQSGADPCPDVATKYRFRTERTVANANIREHCYMTNKELRAVMDDRAYHQHLQKSQAVPGKLVHNANVPRVNGPMPDIPCPPGFEAHAAAGLLPFQQAAAQRAANVKQAAAQRKDVLQGQAHVLERKLTDATWQSVEEEEMAHEA